MEHPENNEAYKGLTVNQGVEQPSIVNPYLKLRKKPKRRQYTAAEYVEGIVKGDVTMLSQAVTLVESVKPEHQVLAQEVIENACLIPAIPSVSASVGCREPERVRQSMCSACTYWKKKVESWPYWLSTPAVSVPKEVSWAIRPVWRNCLYTQNPLSVRVLQLVRWEE